MDISKILCKELGLEEWQVNAVISLSDEGCTIPFIARYRKEAHGSLDDQKIHSLIERLEYLRSLDTRREEIDKAITEQGKMTDEIKASLAAAETLASLEDIYRPFRPKRRTRATIAKEKGLDPLAEKIMAQGKEDPLSLAAEFVNSDLGVETVDDALADAKDIIAEMASDDPEIRKRLRNLYNLGGIITVKAADPEKESVYTMYYDHSEPVSRIASHRVLAIDRGEKEEFLKVSVTIETDKAYNAIEKVMIKNAFSPCADVVREAYIDAYSRLIAPSVEREIRASLTEVACTGAIKNFSNNLHQLLMQPPVKNKVTMGLDPGYRTGCKVAVVDGIGRVLDTGVIYITHGENQLEQAKKKVSSLISKYGVECISIGNGTASKETEMFVSDLLRTTGSKALYMVVSEAGASVYSASKLAAEEFPDYDLTLRSAISIARRLQDPLAELVKIDPKSIGVGQYQHDMPPKQLAEALDFVVENCVNSVGVDLNTASVSLLSRVSGISSAIAKNIVAYREENGALKSRAELKKVPKLGPKAFEQAAGFLRITGGKEPLDGTAVHPESYPAAKALLKTLGFCEEDITKGNLASLRDNAEKAGLPALAEKLGIGVPTLSDVIDELMKPGRDPRDELPPPLLRSDVLEMKDLKPGMEIVGTVRNVIDFGAFVDIGVHQDGLVHISQISKNFIKHPSDVLKTGDIVKVWVISVDEAKKRIALTMIEPKKKDE